MEKGFRFDIFCCFVAWFSPIAEKYSLNFFATEVGLDNNELLWSMLREILLKNFKNLLVTLHIVDHILYGSCFDSLNR